VREVLTPTSLARHQRAAQDVYVDRRVMEYAVALTTATREPPEEGEPQWVEFGASPRGSINLVHAGRALALLRGRDYVVPRDVYDVARGVIGHRLVLSLDALADAVPANSIVDSILRVVPEPQVAPRQFVDGPPGLRASA
jgi:MoxR-like ATPase